MVDLELAQAEASTPPGQAQNPTTRGVAGLRSHAVLEGDSLPSIAHAAYGDPTRWRAIAEANEIDDPLQLQRGRALTIPRLDR
jgi:nucleoid-associated protein YgaU